MSPSGSLPVAVRVKGVPTGMVKLGPASTVGALLPKALSEAALLAAPALV